MTAIVAIDPSASYRRLAGRRLTGLMAALSVLVAGFLLDIATGPALLRLDQVVSTIVFGSDDPVLNAIVWTIRLPTALMAIAVGWALAISGAVMQTSLNNPLASCYTLGISAGAGFGAALSITFASRIPVPVEYVIPVSAFAMSALACAAVFLIGQSRGMSRESMVLAGIAMLFMFQALQSLLQYVASPETLQQIVFWLFGSMLKSTWSKVWIVIGVNACLLPVLLMDAWKLTTLRLGDDRARGLGVNVARLRARVFTVISILTAVAVCFVGTIGFVGLVAPHVARMIVGEDQRYMLPMSGLCGAALLSAASVASKLIIPGAIFPIGIVTAMLGVPFFLWMILNTRRSYW